MDECRCRVATAETGMQREILQIRRTTASIQTMHRHNQPQDNLIQAHRANDAVVIGRRQTGAPLTANTPNLMQICEQRLKLTVGFIFRDTVCMMFPAAAIKITLTFTRTVGTHTNMEKYTKITTTKLFYCHKSVISCLTTSKVSDDKMFGKR